MLLMHRAFADPGRRMLAELGPNYLGCLVDVVWQADSFYINPCCRPYSITYDNLTRWTFDVTLVLDGLLKALGTCSFSPAPTELPSLVE